MQVLQKTTTLWRQVPQVNLLPKGGGSQLVMAITLLLEANPGWVVVALDIVNAFNEIERNSVLESIWEDEDL